MEQNDLDLKSRLSKYTEKRLAFLAEKSECNQVANAAMEILREKYSDTYHWCISWDFMVICEKDKEYQACICK